MQEKTWQSIEVRRTWMDIGNEVRLNGVVYVIQDLDNGMAIKLKDKNGGEPFVLSFDSFMESNPEIFI